MPQTQTADDPPVDDRVGTTERPRGRSVIVVLALHAVIVVVAAALLGVGVATWIALVAVPVVLLLLAAVLVTGRRHEGPDPQAPGAEEALEAAERRRREEIAAVYATVARRSQALLERQLAVIEQLEDAEEDPATLRQLFALDHLATRMNREAASMLVLAGGEPDRRVVGTPPLSEVLRGAVGEIEDYTRVDLELADDRDVDGRVVAPLIHLLAELLENAAAYSPPGSRVTVTGTTTDDGGYRIRIIDRGIGLDDARLAEVNALLADAPDDTPSDNQRLGLTVVTRLVGRLGLPARLDHNTDGRGVTATILLPPALLGPAEVDLADAPAAPAMPVPAPVATRSLTATGGARPSTPTGAPRWTSATGAGRATGAGAAPVAPTPEPEPVGTPQDAPEEPARATSPGAARPAAASGPSMSWSYSGHLRPRPRAVERSAPADPGRGSRSRVTGPAPRPTPQPAPSSAPAPAPAAAQAEVGDLTGLLDAHRAGSPAAGTPASWASQRAQPTAEPPAPAGAPPAADWGDVTAGSAGHADASGPADTPPAGRPHPVASPSTSVDATAGGDAVPAVGTTASGLPRRDRGTALPQALRDPEAEAKKRNAAVAPVSREESRSLLSSYQSRLQAGRRAAEEQVAKGGLRPDTPPADEDRPA